MRFYYTKSLLWGGLLGIYYGEKRLPWPVQYVPKRNEQVGNIVFDLSVINSLIKDVAKVVSPPSK